MEKAALIRDISGTRLLLERFPCEVVERIRQLRNTTPLRDRGGAGLPWKLARTLMQVRQLVNRKLNVTQDRSQQTWTDCLSGMYGNCRCPAVRMPEKDVTPAGPVHGKARSFEGADQFSSLEAWKARHTETC